MDSTIREKNMRYIKALNNAYLNHQLVIFYGAGLSKPLGLPDWGGLVESILGQFMGEEFGGFSDHKERIKQEMSRMDFWKGMNYLKEELDISDSDLKEAIVRIILEGEQLNCPPNQQWEDNNYEDLAKMDVRLFITTNYDKVFPKGLNGRCEIVNFMKSDQSLSDQLSTSGDGKKVIYLHGIVDEPASIVISETDVSKVYSSEIWSTAFSTVLNSSKVLFIGVSFSDEFLRNFLEKIAKINSNSFYAIVLDKIDSKIFSGKQIIVDNKNPVPSIRDILEKISREVENIVFLRIPRFKEEFRNEVKKCLSDNLNILYDIKFSCENGYEIISFQTFKRNQSLKDLGNQVKKVITELHNRKIIYENKCICFISQNTEKVGKQTGALPVAYMKDQKIFLTELISSDSNGFIIDKISLSLSNPEDKEWIQRFSEKKGMILEKNKEYSVYSEEGIKISESHNSGSEVHVAGFIFYKGGIILEKRNSREASVPEKYSLPGGRIKKGEGFQDALKRILNEKYDIIADNMTIVDEFKVHDANIPGLAYGVYIHDTPISFTYELFDSKKLLKLKDNQLACSRSLIDKAFRMLNKKQKIKLRIIMLTECVYKCRCCHHENIKEIFTECQIDKIKENLEILKKNFDIQQITITGGEPLLPANRKNLLSLLRYIRDNWKKMDLSIITNAYYLDNECIDYLKQFNVRYKVSLYGYDESSYRKYTRVCNEIYRDIDYIVDIENKLRYLYENSCNITLNIPLTKGISEGLMRLFGDKKFRQTIMECHIEIKIIDMVKPRRESEFFETDYIQAIPFMKEIGVLEEEDYNTDTFFHTSRFNIYGLHVAVYQYPCEDSLNCENCFNNFALTMKPNGNMLICKEALKRSYVSEELFADNNIEVECIDLGKEYGKNSI